MGVLREAIAEAMRAKTDKQRLPLASSASPSKAAAACRISGLAGSRSLLGASAGRPCGPISSPAETAGVGR